MEQMIIGVDHGYAAVKTAHCSFPCGIVAFEHEPYSMQNVLKYEGRYYVVGGRRQPLSKDKTINDHYFLITLAAIAKELEYRGAPHAADVVLCAGLPLTGFGRDKHKFKHYLNRSQPIAFQYEEKDYLIQIRDVLLYPQGYSAFALYPKLLTEPSVTLVDIGGWTVDVLCINNQIPDASSSRSYELGVIRCVDEIAEQVRRRTGLSLTNAQIEHVLQGGATTSITEECQDIICAYAEQYVRNLIATISESGSELQTMPSVFIGGGASLLKRFLPANMELCRAIVLDDICLNAKSFERLGARLWTNLGHE